MTHPTPERTALHEAACLAYGLLWHACGTDPLVQRARMALLDELSRDDQRHGIQAARAMSQCSKHGTWPDQEIR